MSGEVVTRREISLTWSSRRRAQLTSAEGGSDGVILRTKSPERMRARVSLMLALGAWLLAGCDRRTPAGDALKEQATKSEEGARRTLEVDRSLIPTALLEAESRLQNVRGEIQTASLGDLTVLPNEKIHILQSGLRLPSDLLFRRLIQAPNSDDGEYRYELISSDELASKESGLVVAATLIRGETSDDVRVSVFAWRVAEGGPSEWWLASVQRPPQRDDVGELESYSQSETLNWNMDREALLIWRRLP